jgi:hypothetical protein
VHPAVTSFLADPDLASFDPDGDLARMFLVLDRGAVHNGQTRGVLRTFTWIVAQPLPVRERLDGLSKVIEFSQSHRGTHVLIPSLRRFLDWPEQ